MLDLNREAAERLAGETALHVLECAGHRFEGERELAEVATVAADWFERELA